MSSHMKHKQSSLAAPLWIQPFPIWSPISSVVTREETHREPKGHEQAIERLNIYLYALYIISLYTSIILYLKNIYTISILYLRYVYIISMYL